MGEEAFTVWRGDTSDQGANKMKALVQVNEFLQWLETTEEEGEDGEDYPAADGRLAAKRPATFAVAATDTAPAAAPEAREGSGFPVVCIALIFVFLNYQMLYQISTK